MFKYEQEVCARTRRDLEDHVIEVPNPRTLVFREPGTIMGLMEYRIIGHDTLLVTGDYGCAVFKWHRGSQTQLTFDFVADCNTSYLMEKLIAAPRDIPRFETWDSGVALRTVEDHVQANVECLRGNGGDPQRAFTKWWDKFLGETVAGRECVGHPCTSAYLWASFMYGVASENYRYRNIDFEEMYEVGVVPHPNFYRMREGLRMAVKQWQDG